jgi:hypothetical protein
MNLSPESGQAVRSSTSSMNGRTWLRILLGAHFAAQNGLAEPIRICRLSTYDTVLFATARRIRRRSGRFFDCPLLLVAPVRLRSLAGNLQRLHAVLNGIGTDFPPHVAAHNGGEAPMESRSDPCLGSLVVEIPYVGVLVRHTRCRW